MQLLGNTYGYARVSSRDQNLDRQVDALLAFGVVRGRIFADKASGKDFDRPEYLRLLGSLREGDLLVVTSVDRLGRDYDEILAQWKLITREVGADVAVLDMPLLDTRAAVEGLTGRFMADFVLQLLSYVSQLEREHIRERQAEGIAAARARGTRFGRPRKDRPDGYEAVAARLLRSEISKRGAARELGVSRATLDRWLQEDARGSAR